MTSSKTKRKNDFLKSKFELHYKKSSRVPNNLLDLNFWMVIGGFTSKFWRDQTISSISMRVLKTFPGPGYLCSEDGVVWLWHSPVNLYIWLTISSCYCSIPLALGLMGRDAGLSTLCHGCGFVCQQGVLKTFPGSGSLHSEDEVLWLWHLVVNL